MKRLAYIKELISSRCLNFEEVSEEELKFFENFIDESIDSYLLVKWPESQAFMDEDWFEEEAVLADLGKFGTAAYFIPLDRYLVLDE